MKSLTANENTLVSLLRQAIDIPSVTGEEGKVGVWLEEILTDRNFSLERQPVQADRFNLLATTDQKPRVLLCTHMDVVRPYFASSLDGDWICGRGACDAKASMVAMIGAAEILRRKKVERFGLLFVVGEEVASDGAKKAARLQSESQYVVLGEPTDNKLASGQKGTLVFRVQVTGSEAHSGYPELGRSAVHELIDLLKQWTSSDWGQDSVMGKNTLNIGSIRGGTGPNIIAGEATATGLFRVASSVEEIKNRILTRKSAHVSAEILSSSDPLRLHTLEGFDTTVVSFGSDAPYLRPLGRVILAGPGSIRYAHSREERIHRQSLLAGRDLYVQLVERLLEEVD